MRVTVLGSAASHAGAGQACAGHLVEGGGARILMDCGNGVLANLYRVADPMSLDAVFVTHNHPDHYCDLYSMQAMLRYAPSGPVHGVPIHTPGNLFERMQTLLSERGGVEFREAFDNRVLVDGESIRIADMVVTPMLVDHTEPTFALRVEADGATVAYTADTSPGEHALRAVRDADLVLAEATLPEQYAGLSPHLTSREAGELASAGDVGMLVLVHVWPTNDRFEMARAAAEAFHGQVEVGAELVSFDVIPRGSGR